MDKKYSVEEIRKTYAKAYRPWTYEEDLELRNMLNQGKKTKEIAQLLQRKTGAIKSRIKKLAGQK